MNIEVNDIERDLLEKVLNSYLSELRHDIAATKRDTASLHADEDLINVLLKKISDLH